MQDGVMHRGRQTCAAEVAVKGSQCPLRIELLHYSGLAET